MPLGCDAWKENTIDTQAFGLNEASITQASHVSTTGQEYFCLLPCQLHVQRLHFQLLPWVKEFMITKVRTQYMTPMDGVTKFSKHSSLSLSSLVSFYILPFLVSPSYKDLEMIWSLIFFFTLCFWQGKEDGLFPPDRSSHILSCSLSYWAASAWRLLPKQVWNELWGITWCPSLSFSFRTRNMQKISNVCFF